MSESTAVAPRQASAKSPEVQQRIQEAREKNAIVKAIRGTMWGRDLSDLQRGAIAEYCRANQIDGVRHVEVLGGRLYLTAEFYDERGAHLVRDGSIIPLEPDFIHKDERLEKLAEEKDEWAVAERRRRLELRIKHGVPDAATGACIWRFKVRESGAIIDGVNWCGGGTRKKHTREGLKDADPIGDLEPTKTAETRARRRAWRKIADVIPAYGQVIKPIEEGARSAAPILVVDAEQENRTGESVDRGVGQHIGASDDPYNMKSIEAGQPRGDESEDERILREDRELVDTENRK